MAPKKLNEPDEVMIVNDSPGEECRIAILQSGHLEELYTERTATATDVGNIYKGKVVNVEPAIQAAFIDYGQGANGFLHISDLHPKYFPGEERTERVGKKIPRRERPPIQAALRRGQEIMVQVLKEGIGTKGPTLTSYLSIPGRLLVLMPDMDRVGVSRKVEDEEQRREMRQILDSLDLPDGFGFILRTAGYGKTKTELKRDAAYLLRLWKLMEKRIKSVGAPCELYTESDLLIRTVRDVLRSSIKAILVDSESAFDRASAFLRVVSPRSAPNVIRYARSAPIFHAFDIERQIELIHSREVPLISGGRLVIDQTEALVAIDVNSGRSRSARDSETNAYETNVEAADEICRQLRLRDLGGLIVNDLIDMRSLKHRKLIEERFEANLKRDRARATILKISDFGILEMTRQRMRPSIRKSHFMACSHCNGRGEIKVPEYVAADAARHIGFLLQYERVTRVEIVCSPRVASVLLSGKRRELVRLEDATGKRIDVRVSDAVAVDRVDYYAYDDRNADIDITKLPALKVPSLEELQSEAEAARETGGTMAGRIDDGGGLHETPHRGADSPAIALAGDYGDMLDEFESEDEEVEAEAGSTAEPVQAGAAEQNGAKRGRKRRRRRRGRDHDQQPAAPGGEQPQTPANDAGQTETLLPAKSQTAADQIAAVATSTDGEHGPGSDGQGRRSRRRRGRRRRRGERAVAEDFAQTLNAAATVEAPPAAGAGIPGSGGPADGEQPMRIHELARELSVSSREVIERCEPDPAIHHVANALATVSAEEAQTIREMFAGEPTQPMSNVPPTGDAGGPTMPSKRSRRRRGRRGRGGGRQGGASHEPVTNAIITHDAATNAPAEHKEMDSQNHSPGEQGSHPGGPGRKSRRRRRGRKNGGSGGHVQPEVAAAMHQDSARPGPVAPASAPQASAPASPSTNQPPPKKRRRALYRAGRVAVSSLAREAASQDD